MRKMTIGAMLLTAAAGAFADATWPKNVQFSDDFYKAFKSTVQYERHDVDKGVVVSVAFTNGFDVGKTCDKTEGRKPGCGRTANSHVEIVPAAVYQRARVICTWSDDKKLEPTFTIRITRYNDAPGYTGRAAAGVCDTEVDVRRAVKRKTPDGKWELFIPIDMGDHVDLVTWDRWGTYLNTGIYEGNGRATNIGNYIDVDFISCPARLRSQDGDPRSRMEPDPKRRSGVTVWGFELDRATVAFEPRQFVPGNVFANGDRQETEVDLHVLDYCKYEFEWTVTDAEGHEVGRFKENLGPLQSLRKTIDLSAYGPGWYALTYRLSDLTRKCPVLTHHASFAVLGPDTRKEGIGEGPYGSWVHGGAHYLSRDVDFVGPLLEKAGFRRAQGAEAYDTARRQAYKFSPVTVRMPSPKACSNEEQKVAFVRKQLETDPNVKSFLMFHEDAPWGYQMAPEMTGQKFDEKRFGWHYGSSAKNVDPAKDRELTAKQMKNAEETCTFLRKHFPEIYISLGNSLGCTEFIARLIRNGFKEEWADYMGLESVVRNNLPERQWESSLQAADLMLETAKAFGYNRWKVNACFESCYRKDNLIGADRQAAWYVRDLLLCQAWRFPDVFIGILIDCGNSYAQSFWGDTGVCRRMPWAYPKKSYVGLATATRLLDQVRGVRQIPTGDNCVYAVEYARADGMCVTALWASQGEATVDVDLGWFSGAEFVDFYGRKQEGGRSLKVGSFARYIVTKGPGVKGVRCVRRSYPEDAVPKDAVVVQKADNVAEWQLEAKTNSCIERSSGPFMPYRTLGKYELRQVKDEEMGDCLELELAEPDLSLPTVFGEYAVVELRKPIPLKGRPASIGMMVKGNSGWGKVGWVVEAPNGSRSVSLGGNASADVFDYQGAVSVAFSGWRFMRQIVDRERSSIIDSSMDGSFIWVPGVNANADLKLVGIAFTAENRPLCLTERRPMRQVIRFKDIVTFDAGKARR